jgi:hypothetical protein
LNARTRPEDLRFFRRVGQRGQDLRPLIIRHRREKTSILDRNNVQKGTINDNVAIVPAQTKIQRRVEDRLQAEEEVRNRQLTTKDMEKNQH